MATTLEERVSFLEGRMAEQPVILAGIQQTLVRIDQRIAGVEQKLDGRTGELDEEFDRRLTALDEKFDRRLTAIDDKFDRKLDELSAKMSTHFTWLVGILVTTLAALFFAVLARG